MTDIRGERPIQTLLCIDPGGTTGVALFRDQALVSVGVIHSYTYLFSLIQSLPPETVIVCEDYNAIRLTTDARKTIKLIGAIEYITLEVTGVPPCYQRPQERRSYLPVAKALLGLRTPTGGRWLQHHYDATSHGLCYLNCHFPTVPVTSYSVSELLEVNQFSPLAS